MALRLRRALVGLVVGLVAVVASPAPAGALTEVTGKKVDPFCVGITGTWVEACVGSVYGTVTAVVRKADRAIPL